MTEEERQQKIDTILGTIKKQADYPDVPIHLWITGATEGKPGEPDFEEWMRICTQYVDAYFQETGKRDADSSFAKYVRMYGRREYERQG